MKKTIKKIGALLLALLIFAGPALNAEASYGDYTYSYVYDFWEDPWDCPDFYTVSSVLTSADMGLDKNIRVPGGLYNRDNFIYIIDSGNNRIIELERTDLDKLEVRRIIDSFKLKDDASAELKEKVTDFTFNGPQDMAISEDGNWFIADTNNSRILKLDKDFNYLMQFDIPVDNTLDPDTNFKPSKIVIDTAERVYCVAEGINKGLIKYECDGTFSGFVGATPVTFEFKDYIKKKFATQAQRAQMISFVPTEYDNVFMDKDGFIYALTAEVEEQKLKDGDIDAVRKINLLGNDILVRNGNVPVYGDIYMGTGGGHTGPSQFQDGTIFDNDVFVCVDQNRGRLFGYNDQGDLLFVFGNNGNRDGYFRKPTSVVNIGYDLFVLDALDCTISIFVTTEFGQLVYDAIDLFDEGKYNESGECWEKVMDLDGNYDMAYIGIGRSLLRQERYKEAMEYFELKYDDENYSLAFKQYRKEWVEENIAWILIVLLVLIIVPSTIGKVKSIKAEIARAEIFKV